MFQCSPRISRIIEGMRIRLAGGITAKPEQPRTFSFLPVQPTDIKCPCVSLVVHYQSLSSGSYSPRQFFLLSRKFCSIRLEKKCQDAYLRTSHNAFCLKGSREAEWRRTGSHSSRGATEWRSAKQPRWPAEVSSNFDIYFRESLWMSFALLRVLKAEIVALQRARDAEVDLAETKSVCTLCMTPLGWILPGGATCPSCNRKVCSACRLPVQLCRKKKWMCTLCAKEWYGQICHPLIEKCTNAFRSLFDLIKMES